MLFYVIIEMINVFKQFHIGLTLLTMAQRGSGEHSQQGKPHTQVGIRDNQTIGGKKQHCAFTNFQSRLGRWDGVQCDASIQVMCEESGKGIVIPVPFRYSFWDFFDLYEAGGWSTNLPIRSPLNLNIRVL